MFNRTELEVIENTAKTLVGYEHAKLVRFDDEHGQATYTAEQLAESGETGTLTSVFRDKKGKLNYRMQQLCHAMIIGASGSGKSTGYIAHQLMATAFSGKASMVVVDSKGVLYETYADYLKKLGYDVRLLNIQRSGWQHSEGFNPFAESVENYRNKMKEFGNGVKVVCGNDGKRTFKYKGNEYADEKALERAFRLEKTVIDEELMSEIDVLVDDLWPVENGKDPYWERSGRSMYAAVLFALAEDMFPIGVPQTTVDMVNLRNMKSVIASFNIETGDDDSEKDHGYLSYRGQSNVAFDKVRLNCYHNAGNALRNILGIMRESISRYDVQSIQAVSLKTTVDPKWLAENKAVLFLSYDETNEIEQRFLNFVLSGLMKRLKNVADATINKTLSRPVMFIVDEFATMPRNKFVPAFIGYGRSRNVFLSIVLQSYAQLMTRYGDSEGKTILDNTNVKIFLATNDFDTKRNFSESLGKQTIVSPDAMISGNIAFVERPLVTCSDLTLLKQGDCYVQSIGNDALFGHFEPSYTCEEYTCKRVDISSYGSCLSAEADACMYDVEAMLKMHTRLEAKGVITDD